jgi:hypothetical protein
LGCGWEYAWLPFFRLEDAATARRKKSRIFGLTAEDGDKGFVHINDVTTNLRMRSVTNYTALMKTRSVSLVSSFLGGRMIVIDKKFPARPMYFHKKKLSFLYPCH